MATQKIKQAIIETLDDVKSNVIYSDTLPETAENGTMVVVEKSNQYFQRQDGGWVELNPYRLPL